jgi:hypothetical protein
MNAVLPASLPLIVFPPCFANDTRKSEAAKTGPLSAAAQHRKMVAGEH